MDSLLRFINIFRRMHGVPPLLLSEEMSKNVATPVKGAKDVAPPRKGAKYLPPRKGAKNVAPPRKGAKNVPPPRKGIKDMAPPRRGAKYVPPRKGAKNVALPIKVAKKSAVANNPETLTCSRGSREHLALECVVSWYSHVKDYDWAEPKLTAQVHPFTQLVWKSSTHVGISMSGGAGSNYTVVASFEPPQGQESARENVLPVSGKGQSACLNGCVAQKDTAEIWGFFLHHLLWSAFVAMAM